MTCNHVITVGPRKGEVVNTNNIYNPDSKYEDIFELRKVKTGFLINDMPKLVKHYIFIKYEDLRDNYERVLGEIKTKFDLEPRNETYQNVLYYKDAKYLKYNPVSYRGRIPSKWIKYIREHLDWSTENQIGYYL